MSDDPPPQVDWQAKFLADSAPWERPGLHPAFAGWLPVAGRGRALVPGAGRSPEPLALAEAGAAVTAIDLAPAAAEWQRARFAAAGRTAEIIVGDALAHRPAVPYDVVYEQTCLCAISPRQREAYAAAARDWLRPGGTLLALFMQTGGWGGPPYDCPIAAMRALFDAADWIWPAGDLAPHPHPRGWTELAAALIRR